LSAFFFSNLNSAVFK